MPRIKKVGILDWAGTNYFSFESRNDRLFEMEMNEEEDAVSSEKASNWLGNIQSLREAAKNPYLELTLRITLDDPDNEDAIKSIEEYLLGEEWCHMDLDPIHGCCGEYDITIFVTEDIKQPTRFIESLARKMSKWVVA